MEWLPALIFLGIFISILFLWKRESEKERSESITDFAKSSGLLLKTQSELLAYLDDVKESTGFDILRALPTESGATLTWPNQVSDSPFVTNPLYGVEGSVETWIFDWGVENTEGAVTETTVLLIKNPEMGLPRFRIYPESISSPFIRKLSERLELKDQNDKDIFEIVTGAPGKYTLQIDEEDAELLLTEEVVKFLSKDNNWTIIGCKEILTMYKNSVSMPVDQFSDIRINALAFLNTLK